MEQMALWRERSFETPTQHSGCQLRGGGSPVPGKSFHLAPGEMMDGIGMYVW